MNSGNFVDFLLAKRKIIAAVALVSILLSILSVLNIRVDNDSMKSVPDNFKEKVDIENIQKKFPTPYMLVFMAKFKSGTIREKCDSLESWAKAFEAEKIDTIPCVSSVVHLGKIQVPVKGGFIGIKTEPLIPMDKDLSDSVAFRRIADNKEFVGSFVSEDGSVMVMALMLHDKLSRTEITARIESVNKELQTKTDAELYITGASATPYFLSNSMRRDFRLLLPIAILISILFLYSIFRRILFVAAPILIISLATLWTFALMALVNVPLSVVTSIIPIILFPVGLADSIHIIKTYTQFHIGKGLSFEESIKRAYRELLRPVLLTSITTFFGFGTFIFSDILWTRQFGLFTGIGVIFSLMLTLILLPIFLYYDKKMKTGATFDFNIVSDSQMNGLRNVLFSSRAVLLSLAIITIVGFYGSSRVEYDSNPITFFSKDSYVRKCDDLVSKYFKGTRFFYISLSHGDAKLTKPAMWSAVDSIQKFMETDTVHVGEVSSLVPLLNRTSRLLSNKDISSAAISLVLKSKGLFGKSFRSMVRSQVSEDKIYTKLSLTCKNISGFKYSDYADSMATVIENKFPGWHVEPAGPALMIDAMINLIIRTQIISVLTAFISIFIILVMLYKSVPLGFYTTIPIIVSTLFVYAFMGLMNITVNTVTVTVVNTCVGIGIDYAIHFTSGFIFEKGLNSQKDNRTLLLEIFRNKGSVILFNTISVGSGFLVLVFSSFPPIRSFGILIFISMLSSSFFSLFMLPWLLRNFKYNPKKEIN